MNNTTSTNTCDEDELYREVEYAIKAEYKAPNGEPAKSRIDRLMRLILTREQSIKEQAEREAVTVLKSRMSKHFTKWGSAQGNCVPEDTLDDFLDSLHSTNNSLEEK